MIVERSDVAKGIEESWVFIFFEEKRVDDGDWGLAAHPYYYPSFPCFFLSQRDFPERECSAAIMQCSEEDGSRKPHGSYVFGVVTPREENCGAGNREVQSVLRGKRKGKKVLRELMLYHCIRDYVD